MGHDLKSRLKRIEQADSERRRKSERPAQEWVILDPDGNTVADQVPWKGPVLKAYYAGFSPDDL